LYRREAESARFYPGAEKLLALNVRRKTMYRRIALTIALAAAVISLSLVTSDSTVRAQKQNKYAWNTGAIMLGPDQILRITVNLGDTGTHYDGGDTGTHEARVQFKKINYTAGTCSGGVCVSQVASQNTSSAMSLSANEAASIDMYSSANPPTAVGGIVLSNNQNLRVNALIINTVTGEAGAVYNIGWEYGHGDGS
jgi:hypothetical protein